MLRPNNMYIRSYYGVALVTRTVFYENLKKRILRVGAAQDKQRF